VAEDLYAEPGIDPVANGQSDIEDVMPDKSDEEIAVLLNSYYCLGKADNLQYKDERNYIRRLFKNAESTDYFDVSGDNIDGKRQIYRSGLVQNSIELRTALLLDSKPRCFLNPVFKEDMAQSSIKAIKIYGKGVEGQRKYGWMVEALKKCKGSFECFYNNVVDASVDDWWEKSAFTTTLEVLIKNAFIDTKSYVKLRKNDDETNIIAELILAEHVYTDPTATLPEERRFVFFCKAMSCRNIERKFDLEQGTIKPDDEISEFYTDPNEVNSGAERRYREARAKLIEAQVRHEDGSIYVFKFVPGQNVPKSGGIMVLDKFKSDYNDFTIIELIPVLETRTCGLNMGRNVAPLQEMDDKTVQQAFQNFSLMGNAKILVEMGALQNANSITNKIAQIVPVDDIDSMQFIPGVQTTNEAMGLHGIFQQGSRDVSGLHEVAEGRTHGRIESSKAYVVVDDIITRRLRPTLRNVEAFLKRMFVVWGQMWLEIHTKDMPLRVGPTFRTVRKLPVALSAIIDSFDVSIGQDTTLPKDPQAKANLFLTLAQTPGEDGRPMIPRAILLEALGVENKDEIEAYYNTIDAYKEQAIAAAQQVEQMAQALQQIQEQMQQLAEANEKLEFEKKAGDRKAVNAAMLDAQKRVGINETEKVRIDGEAMLEILKAQLGKLEGMIQQGQSGQAQGATISNNPAQTSTNPSTILGGAGETENLTDEQIEALMANPQEPDYTMAQEGTPEALAEGAMSAEAPMRDEEIEAAMIPQEPAQEGGTPEE
jgi:DNA-binding protein YbaB